MQAPIRHPRTAQRPGGNRDGADGGGGVGPGTLLVVLTGTFMTALDVFIVNVAIPSIARDLSAGPSAIQWIVAGYAMAIAASLITGGRLGDLYGRRRMFIQAMALFTLASAACGLAPTSGFLITARVVQGIGAALLIPQVLAILNTAYHGTARARAINSYGVTLGLAAVVGQLIGGALIEADLLGLGWRSIFLINVPVGAAAIALTTRHVPKVGGTGRSRLDLTGVLLVTAALVATALPLIQGREQDWPLWTWLCAGAAAVLFAGFARQQRRAHRQNRAPLIDPGLFRARGFTTGLLAQAAFWLGQASFFLILAVYLQEGRGLDALRSGELFMALGVGYLATSLVARQVSARLGGGRAIAAGAGLMLAGEMLMAVTVNLTDQATWLVPALAVHAAGMGLAVAPLAATALARVAPEHAGAASGVLGTAQQVGNSLGVAAIGIVYYSAAPADHTRAFTLGLGYLAAVAVVVAVLARLLPGPAMPGTATATGASAGTGTGTGGWKTATSTARCDGQRRATTNRRH